ncbi:helix-turn-helix domain-containing protein [Salmonella enterica subsp. enterica serovar Leoben]|uniref:helix-turn-helix domain-containing protein n=1 Tax=Salmonella enterica TaxID=28901 RepID=UPI0012792B6C|nr:helix-turn-helix domain-containing protein [Salmonella enterica]EAW2488311.1 helix-turn-helix domain-containing protein [Salmonella enterica subsp. enterica]EBF7439229.1 helix-turn-helix domain-containing protein [Salmonella enterica subsp. enterica serovar Muenchen]EBU8531147.1 transcriptional regulator [Salmonella enterica subsp. enterica serovar Leoben]ECD4421222.1 helix-turn-helix domain-containing protein [Salmonella enterica subsp. enterica serovar Berkeley]EDW0103193.1 helix-turn-hel
MTRVKHHFTNKSNIACLPTSKAIIYNEAMSDNTLTNGLISRLAELNKKGFSKTEMARVAGVSKQAVSSWFKTGRISKSSALAIADAAGVSVPWLLGEDVGEKDGLKPDEQRLLELYRQLPEEEQQNMLRIVSLRLKELDELYAKYMGRRIKGDVE